jgi:hypothetical protein
MASNNGYSSASVLKSSLNGGSLPTAYSSKSKSKLLYDWRFTANQFVLASSPLRLTIRDFFQLNSCGNSPYNPFTWNEYKTPFPTVRLLLHVYPLQRERVY